MQATVTATAAVHLLKQIGLGSRGGGVQLDSSFLDYIREEGKNLASQMNPLSGSQKGRGRRQWHGTAKQKSGADSNTKTQKKKIDY